jgi:hypothetical protein
MADRCAAAQVPTLLQGLSSHSIQLFAGVNASEIRELLNAASDSQGPETARPILLLGLPQAHSTETIIASAIDQVAGAVTDVWPLWFGGEDFSGLNDSALSHHYLPIKLATLTRRFPSLSTSWAEAAIRQLLRGRRPRVPKFGAETEWFQLCHAVNPNGLIAVVTLEDQPPPNGLAVVHAFEWLAEKGNVAMAVLCRELPPREFPFDRLLYGARSLLPMYVEDGGHEAADAEALDGSSVSLLLPPVHGRPHPQSAVEQRLSKMIEVDAELASKFSFPVPGIAVLCSSLRCWSSVQAVRLNLVFLLLTVLRSVTSFNILSAMQLMRCPPVSDIQAGVALCPLSPKRSDRRASVRCRECGPSQPCRGVPLQLVRGGRRSRRVASHTPFWLPVFIFCLFLECNRRAVWSAVAVASTESAPSERTTSGSSAVYRFSVSVMSRPPIISARK